MTHECEHSHGILYLRDFNEQTQEQLKKMIREKRPDLMPTLEEGDDIVVGDLFHAKEFEIA